MPFSLQFFGVVLLQKARHSPKKNASCQKGAGHYHETRRFVSEPFDKVEARQYLKVFHKKLISIFRPVISSSQVVYLKIRANLGTKRKPLKTNSIGIFGA